MRGERRASSFHQNLKGDKMNNFFTLIVIAIVATLIAMGCSPTPAAPPAPPAAQTTQFATQAPTGAKVVKAFSKMDAGCLGKSEWTVEASPDAWIDVGTGWFAKDGKIAEDNWKHVSNVITLDGKEVQDLTKYYHGPKPFKLECPDNTITAEIVGLEIYSPPLSVGDHKLTWKSTIESDLNDGYDDYKKGTVFEFTGTVRVKPNVTSSK
jgi:hypothetical protein